MFSFFLNAICPLSSRDPAAIEARRAAVAHETAATASPVALDDDGPDAGADANADMEAFASDDVLIMTAEDLERELSSVLGER